MRKKVKNVRSIDLKTKLAVGVLIVGLSANQVGVLANNDNVVDNISITDNLSDIDFDRVLKSLYQEQMEYLVPTLDKLNVFYNDVDKDNIIKVGYPNAYEMSKIKLNYFKIYNSVNYDYICLDNIEEAIIKNNKIIGNLKIKPVGNGRDPEYGIIRDNSSLGFRRKTDKDRELIDIYTEIVGDRVFVNQDILDLIKGINNGDNVEELLINVLKETYNNQIAKIEKIRNNLGVFYKDKDAGNFIKTSYEGAYNSYIKDLNYIKISYGSKEYNFIPKFETNNLSNKEIVDKYLELVKENCMIINNFNIKRNGSARDTDYNMIKDKDGYRIKTNSDLEFIERYTDLLGEKVYDNVTLINLFDYSKDYNLKNNVGVKKTLSNITYQDK